MTKSRDTADSINRIDSSAANATAMTIDSSEQVGIGTAPSTKLDVLSSGATIARFKRDNTGGASGGISVGNNDKLFTLYSDGVGGLQFYEDSTERIRFQLGGGISFNGDSAAANALDDYEEGTWTPTIGNGTINETNAKYTKVGNVVTVTAEVYSFSDRTTNASVVIGGLPFASDGSAISATLARYVNTPTGGDAVVMYHAPSGSSLTPHTMKQNSNYDSVAHNDLGSTSTYFYITHTYRV